MGKRSDFERKPRDFYQTPIEAVVPLISHLPKKGLFAEPCAGDGRLIKHIEELSNLKAYWMTDIEPQVDWVGEFDVFDADVSACDICITNPPWDRKILHSLIDHWLGICPTWLLFYADWMHTKQSALFMTYCSKVVSIGRVKWIEGSKSVGKDNCCWYLFDAFKEDMKPTEFYGRVV